VNQVAFAALCGVTKQMVTKWKVDGRLAYDASGVDAALSLANLAGAMNEELRQGALAKLQGLPAPANDQPIANQPTDRQKFDAVRLERETLALAKEKGELIAVKLVQPRAMEAVSRLQLALESRQHPLTDAILEVTQADPMHRTAIARLIRNYRAEAMSKFATDMLECAQVQDDQPLPVFDGSDLELATA
jgi:hypothetical protein